MEKEHINDFSLYLEELRKESDRGLPLVGVALIDEKLKQTLKAFFVEGKISEKLLSGYSSPLETFSSRIDTCYALGLLDEFEYQEINLIRKVRNEFAHAKHGISFKTKKIKGLCSSLKSHLPEGSNYPLNDARFRLTNAIVTIASRLYYRPQWVEKERRKTKEWVDEDMSRWRSVEDELLPNGTPVIVMRKKE